MAYKFEAWSFDENNCINISIENAIEAIEN